MSGDARTAISAFTEAFIRRTKRARELSGMTQEDMATVLGIAQDTYKQYETRTPLPHRYIAPFCFATRAQCMWLFTGRNERSAA